MATNRFLRSRAAAAAAITLLPLLLGSCQALYFLQGKGNQEALFKLPPKQRVLVFVDAPASVALPPDYATTLGADIGQHLYRYKAADDIVAQDRLKLLRESPSFARMGIADVANAANADVVVYVNIIHFNVGLISGGTVSQGDATATVKVVDKTGRRLWPADQPLGMTVTAHVNENLADERDLPATLKDITHQLTIHAGRLFHKYSLDDPEMTR